MKALIFAVLCSLSLSKLQIEGQVILTENFTEKLKSKFSLNRSLKNPAYMIIHSWWFSSSNNPSPYTVPTLSGELRYQSMHSLFDQITDVSIHMRSFFFIFCYRQCREECRDYVIESDVSTIVFAYFCHGWNGVFCRIHIFSTSGIFGVDDLEKQWNYIW